MATTTKRRKPKAGTLGDQLSALKRPEIIRAMGAGKAQAKRKEVERAIAHAKRVTCSPRWAEDVIYQAVEYPPGGKQTGMVRCRGCETWVPGIYVTTSGHCRECQHDSLSRYALAKLPKGLGIIDMGRLKASIRKGQQYNG